MKKNVNFKFNTSRLFPIFEYNIQEIQDPRKPKNVYIFAGKGLGKSTFLDFFSELLNNRGYKIDLLTYNYESYKKFLNVSNKIEVNRNYGLLIDDFDHFFIELIEREPDRFVHFIKKFVNIKINKKKITDSYLVLTGRTLPSIFLSFINEKANLLKMKEYHDLEDYYSNFFTDLEHSPLFPWHPNWGNIIEAIMYSFYKDRLGKDVIKSWAKVICELSGGHPMLLGICKEELDRLVSIKKEETHVHKGVMLISSFEEKLLTKPVDKKMLSLYLEDILVNKGLGMLRRVLDYLKDTTQDNYPLSLDYLVRMAADRDYQPENATCRGILINNGLIYRDSNSGKYQLISKILRDTLVGQGLSKTKAILQFSLKPSQDNPEGSGDFIIITNERELEIRLRDSQWRLIKLLYKEKGKLFTYDRIKADAKIPSLEALRLINTRVTQKFKEAGFPNLIENVREKGYILNI
ncbi:MAG: helix-turn-helix domain-containing protein [Candidatus Aminicenantes bacterium]|nr:helix-turn-helix domain-containing protein [Candidatus Aminicenantes bacterium]